MTVRETSKQDSQGATLIVNTLKQQVKEARNSLQVQQTAIRDLGDKMREMQETLTQRAQTQRQVLQTATTKQDRGQSVQAQIDSQQNLLLILKADLADKQREFQASKLDRSTVEQQLWDTDDLLKNGHVEHLKEEQHLNEIVREYEKRVEELRYND